MKASSRVAEVVLAQFATQEQPPRLNQAGQQILRDYFEEQRLVMVAGATGTDSTDMLVMNAKTDYVTSAKTQDEVIIGPNFLGGEYYPEGIGLWIPVRE